MKKPVGNFLALVVATFVAVIVLPILMATAIVWGQEVAQSYTANSSLQPGMIVQPADDKTKVKPVTANESEKMLGVVIQPNDAPLSLSEATAGEKVYVATAGSYRILVSNQNGVIKKGDYLIISSLEGIGMKVDGSAQYVVGKTLEGFDGASAVLSQTTVKDTTGTNKTVNFGYVKAEISISRNPLLRSSAPASTLPNFLQKASEAIANKPVPPVRVYISLAVVIVTAIIVCTILYAGIRTSVISMGRNPLARNSIMRSLTSVLLIGMIILITGLFGVYLLLKL